MAQAESPEWTPASSMCSMMPADDHLLGRRRWRRRPPRWRLRGSGRSAPAGPRATREGLGHEAVQLLLRRSRSPSPGRRARSWAAPAPDSRSCGPRCGPGSWSRAMPLAGCFRFSRVSRSLNFSRSSASSMVSTLVPMIGTPALDSARARFKRRLPAELHDHAVGLDARRRCSARPRWSAARRTAGRWCRSRWTPSPGWS